MTLLGFTLGFLELAAFGVFCIAMLIGATFDRSYRSTEWKWWTTFFGLAALIAFHWSDLSVSGLISTVLSWSFWTPALIYLGLGLVYTMPEFYMTIRRSAKEFSASWQSFICSSISGITRNDPPNRFRTMGEAIKFTQTATDVDLTGNEYNTAVVVFVRRSVEDYVRRKFNSSRIIYLKHEDNSVDVTPAVNKRALVNHVGAWTIFWPFYLVSLVLGDIVAEIFEHVAEFLTRISGRVVRATFADVFKI